MLTFVESLSLAGDRAKQNDDACGFRGACAWMIDGATDLHDAPLTGAASDAAWLAQQLNIALHGLGADSAVDIEVLRDLLTRAQEAVAVAFAARVSKSPAEKWRSPIASVVLMGETESGVAGLDLGDSRLFALDADGAAHAFGGPPAAADWETKAAAKAAESAGAVPLLRHADTLALLRRGREAQNGGGASWTFGLDPACVTHARQWAASLARPAHLLLATDGFAALTDRYGAYDPSALVQAALDKGLQELGRELRQIEAQDAQGARHPRWKRSDDATALLLRLS